MRALTLLVSRTQTVWHKICNSRDKSNTCQYIKKCYQNFISWQEIYHGSELALSNATLTTSMRQRNSLSLSLPLSMSLSLYLLRSFFSFPSLQHYFSLSLSQVRYLQNQKQLYCCDRNLQPMMSIYHHDINLKFSPDGPYFARACTYL